MDLYPLLVPPGNDTEVPFNDGGLFGSDSTFTFNKATGTLTAGSATIAPNTTVFQPTANSTTAFQWKDQAGAIVGNFDTTNKRFGLLTSSADEAFVIGDGTGNPVLKIYGDEAGSPSWGTIFVNTAGNLSIGAAQSLVFDIAGDFIIIDDKLRMNNNKPINFGNASKFFIRYLLANDRLDIFDSDLDTGITLSNQAFLGLNEPAPETLLELTHATPTWTTHGSNHDNSDNAPAGKWVAKREDGAGTETEAGTQEFSHDGSGANDQLAKWVLGVNTGSGVVEAMRVDSNKVVTIPGIGGNGLTSYDLKIGDTITPDYGLLQAGAAVFGRVGYNAMNMDLDGSVIIRNLEVPATSNIEFAFLESGGTSIRFALAKSAAGNATYNPRSMLIAGPAVWNDDIVTVGYWQTNNSIFHNLACDTAGPGADLGVQNDLEVEGDIFVDSIKESTSGSSVTFGNDVSFANGKNIIFNTTTGTKVGTATTQKLSFWNAAPVVQPVHIVDADGTLGDITTKFNALLAQMATTGLQAAA